jgi:hypothetical protein
VLVVGCAALGWAGCHADSPSQPDAETGDGPVVDADPGWTELIGRSWTLGPGREGYRCTRIQVPADMWISGFRTLAPVGTYRDVLTISTTSSPLGDYDCAPGNIDQQLLYASGVATDDLRFPDGVAIHLTAGMYLNLNLYLVNPTADQLSDTSAVLVRTVDATQVAHEADMMFAGTFNINVPSDGQPHIAQGGCTAPADWHVLALWPRMHQTAVHQSLVVTHASTPTTVLDAPYDFDVQKNYPMQDTMVHAGDAVSVTCTYVNTTGIVMTYGDLATAETCFTGIYKYPAGGQLYDCTSS